MPCDSSTIFQGKTSPFALPRKIRWPDENSLLSHVGKLKSKEIWLQDRFKKLKQKPYQHASIVAEPLAVRSSAYCSWSISVSSVGNPADRYRRIRFWWSREDVGADYTVTYNDTHHWYRSWTPTKEVTWLGHEIPRIPKSNADSKKGLEKTFTYIIRRPIIRRIRHR